MAGKRLLPGFDTTPGPHRTLVQYSKYQHPIIFRKLRPNEAEIGDAERDLRRKRDFATRLAPLGVEIKANGELANTSSWNELREVNQDWLVRHIGRVVFPVYPGYENAEQVRTEVIQATKGGIATNVAFAEVVGKVLFRHDFDDANAQIAAWVRRSVGFMLEWSGVARDVDTALAWALASPKPSKPWRVFNDLHFSSRWFIDDTYLGRVGLDSSKVQHLRDYDNRHPQNRLVGVRPLFPCPAVGMIPDLHDRLVGQAEASGLFGQTYMLERANHGYEDAWVALEGLTLGKE